MNIKTSIYKIVETTHDPLENNYSKDSDFK